MVGQDVTLVWLWALRAQASEPSRCHVGLPPLEIRDVRYLLYDTLFVSLPSEKWKDSEGMNHCVNLSFSPSSNSSSNPSFPVEYQLDELEITGATGKTSV